MYGVWVQKQRQKKKPGITSYLNGNKTRHRIEPGCCQPTVHSYEQCSNPLTNAGFLAATTAKVPDTWDLLMEISRKSLYI